MSGCVRDEEPKGADLQVGDPLPQFEVIMSDGDTITTESLYGKIAIITFFNTDCRDCRDALPYLQQQYEVNKLNDIYEFVLIAREEEAPQIEEYWKDNGLTMPYSPQSNRKIYNLFRSSGIPVTYITDLYGKIDQIHEGWKEF